MLHKPIRDEGSNPVQEPRKVARNPPESRTERRNRSNTTGTWATALLLADLEWRYTAGADWFKYEKKSQSTSSIPVGTLVFLTKRTGNAGFIDIDHMGIVTKVLEPLWTIGRWKGWFSLGAKEVWAVAPGAWVFQDNSPDCDNYLTCQPGTP